MKSKKKKYGTTVLAVCIVAVVIIAAILCGVMWNREDNAKKTTEQSSGQTAAETLADGEYALEQDDPMAILSAVVGDTQGEVVAVVENGETSYWIKVLMTADFPFEKTTLNLELADEAGISDESNCILTDLGGRLVVNQTVENACIVVEKGEETREYRFLIALK